MTRLCQFCATCAILFTPRSVFTCQNLQAKNLPMMQKVLVFQGAAG